MDERLKMYKQYKNSRAAGMSFGAAVGSIFVAVGLVFAEAWLVMLLLGGLHDSVPAVPALGFGASLLLFLLATLLFKDVSLKE